MSAYLIIFSTLNLLVSLSIFVFALLVFFKLPKVGRSISNKILESEERQVAVSTITGQALRTLEEETKQNKNDLSYIVCAQSAEIQRKHKKELETLRVSNEKIAEHMAIYAAVLESQDRLIQAVSDLVEAKSSARRRG